MALEELSFESVNRRTTGWTDDRQKVITIAHPDHPHSGQIHQITNDSILMFECFPENRVR